MTPRAQGVAMLGLVGIAAVILYMHQSGIAAAAAMPAAAPSPTVLPPLVNTAPAPPNVYPLRPIGTQSGGTGHSCCSWCGGIL